MDCLRHGIFRQLSAFLLLALLVKVLVPAGFMPTQNADGKTEIVICTGHGPVTHIVDIKDTPFYDPAAEQERQQQDEQRDKAASCPFMTTGAQGMTAALPVALPVTARRDGVPVLRAQPLYNVFSLKPWLSQGPPRFS